jgi:hypothetical protein
VLAVLLALSSAYLLVVRAAPPDALADDRGKFRILLDGQNVGSEEFSIGRSGNSWVCRGSVNLKVPGAGTAEVTSQLHLSAEGSPQQYIWTSKGEKKVTGGVVFTGGTAQMELRVEDAQPFSQDFQFDSGRIVILDNNLYHHYAILARIYDWKGRGTQTFSVLIPQDLTPGTITAEYAGMQEVGDTKMEMLRVRSADLEVELFVVGGKLMRLAVPSAKVEVVRE